MFFRAVLVTLGLAASVSATARPRDDTLVPELIATPSNYANATARQDLVDPRSLEARQAYCNVGYHACSDRGCCENTRYCVVIDGILGCCPNGRVCNRPPQGPPRCTNTGYYVCPSQEFCCPYGADCKRDIYNNPQCEWSNSSPPPETTYEYLTTTSTYDSWTTSTSIDVYTSTTKTTSSAYITYPRSSPTTTASIKFDNPGNDTASIQNAQTTTSLQSGDGPPVVSNNAQKSTLGYAVTGVVFLSVVAGLV